MSQSNLGTDIDYRGKALEFFSKSFEAFYEHGIAVDRDSHVTWISAPYYHFLGLTESPIGKHITRIVPNSFMPGVVQTGEPVFLDLLFVRDQWVVVSAFPLKDDHGRIAGAFGFVSMDRMNRVKPLLEKYQSLQKQLDKAQDELRKTRRARHKLSQIVGASEPMQAVKKQIRQAAKFDMAVLICGETGTGKELFAHALHDLSVRAQRPFVSINVAAIPEQLLEAEFFGVAPGAYTGADKRGREGKFHLANGGTLFLDEIGDMRIDLQVKLLRVLQEKEFEKVGSNRLERADVRIVAATSKDLGGLVESDQFRSDLYYRLCTFPIQLPPLRVRREDIEGLCERLLEEISVEYGILQPELSHDALELLRHHHWPGNVRELRNVMERACAQAESMHLDAALIRELLPAQPEQPELDQTPVLQRGPSTPPPTLADVLVRAERQAIIDILDYTQGNKTLTAQYLGIARPTLYEKLKRLGIY